MLKQIFILLFIFSTFIYAEKIEYAILSDSKNNLIKASIEKSTLTFFINEVTYKEVKKILKSYPDLKWIFISDEKNQHIYLKILQEFPTLVHEIYIKNVQKNTIEKLYPNTLASFKSDGCSMFINGTLLDKDLWLHCCIEHDEAYWMGGIEIQKENADIKLQECVEETGHKYLSHMMLFAVKFAGNPNIPSSFRWGFGWNINKGFEDITNYSKERK